MDHVIKKAINKFALLANLDFKTQKKKEKVSNANKLHAPQIKFKMVVHYAMVKQNKPNAYNVHLAISKVERLMEVFNAQSIVVL